MVFALTQALVDHRIQFRFLKGFGQVVVRAEAHRLHYFLGVVDAGKHYDLHSGPLLPELLQRLQPVDSRHQHIEQHQVRLHAFVHALQSLFAGRSGFHFVVVDLQQRPDIAEHGRFVIHQKNLGGLAHRFFPLPAGFGEGLKGMRNENLQPAPGSLSTQIFPPMPCTRRRTIAKPSPMPSWLSVARQAEEIIEDFLMKLRRNSRTCIGHADLHGIGLRSILPAPLTRRGRLGRRTAFPHVGFGVQPNRPALRNKLERVLQQIRDHPLQLRRIEGKHRQLVIRQKVKRQSLFLKARRPQPAHVREAVVDIARLELHLQAAGFQSAVGQEVLNELLQPLAARLHVAQHFPLARIQRSQFLALQ